jgi:hypothetical protein
MAETLIFHWFEVIFHLILIIEGYRAEEQNTQTLAVNAFGIS